MKKLLETSVKHERKKRKEKKKKHMTEFRKQVQHTKDRSSVQIPLTVSGTILFKENVSCCSSCFLHNVTAFVTLRLYFHIHGIIFYKFFQGSLTLDQVTLFTFKPNISVTKLVLSASRRMVR